ncbi:extracellular matrix structural constituent [Fragilaria crotonensis]|nr:extracellular matrix structural constituent [Fragilaria crotonensis]
MRLSFAATLVTTLLRRFCSGWPFDCADLLHPLPDDEMLNTFHDCHPKAQTPITSIIAVSVAAAGTKIIWDHWEDGYEVDPSTPSQSTTAIWGDGNIANGAPPGVTTNAGDVLRAGQSIVIQNDVPIPRIKSKLFFDGKDKVMSTYPIAMTRSGYAGNSGPPMAGAVEVMNTRLWGTEHIAIVGEDTDSNTNSFELSQFYVMAAYDGTSVTHPSKPGGALTTSVINQGETLIVSVNEYEKVTSDKPVQVDLFCGDVGAHFETRWYSISPRNAWTNEYYSPVAESFGNTGFWFYNPDTTAITITFYGGNLDNSGGTFTIPGGQSVFKEADTNKDFDITGVGNDPLSTTFRADFTGLQFTSTKPFYGDSYIFVDYDGDRIFDKSFKLDKLDALLLQDDSDYDMSGAIIAAFSSRTGGIDNSMSSVGTPGGDPVNIAVAWGQNPSSSQMDFQSQEREMDLGTAVLPLANPWVSKRVVKVLNPDGTEDPRLVVDQTGDVIYYEISATNVGFGNVYGFTISDELITSAGGVLTGPIESITTNGILEPMEQFMWTVRTTLTDLTGFYQFTNVEAGDYYVVETNRPSYFDVSDADGGINLSSITIFGVVGGQEYTKKDFVDEYLATLPPTASPTSPPTENPTMPPTSPPSPDPTQDPTSPPTFPPSPGPTMDPTSPPSPDPTQDPTSPPTSPPTPRPTMDPTSPPSPDPTQDPTSPPTSPPSLGPTMDPTSPPSPGPTMDPTSPPSPDPTQDPTSPPTSPPSLGPTMDPTSPPSPGPTMDPTSPPSPGPSMDPTSPPSPDPTQDPTSAPTSPPSPDPTSSPTNPPNPDPTNPPTLAPSSAPTNPPSPNPTMSPTPGPSAAPSSSPSIGQSSVPSAVSSASPSEAPSKIGLFAITGNVMEDNNRDKAGDVNLPNVAIALLDSNNVVIKTTLTDASGNYKFDGLLPGKYFVKETNLDGYTDVTDSDGGDLNEIVVNIVSSNSNGNDFVDEQPSGPPSAGPSSVPSAISSASPSEAPSKTGLFAITGTVMEDNNRDKAGDVNLPNVAIALLDSNNVVIKTTLTDASGNYKFDGLLPGKYFVKETNLDGYTDVTDSDGGDLNEIVVNIVSSNSNGNDFVDEQPSGAPSAGPSSVPSAISSASPSEAPSKTGLFAITGTVMEDNNRDKAGDVNLPQFDISGYDVTNDNDPTDGIPSLDKNVINVTLTFGEVDDGNDFVDSVDPADSPSSAPIANPTSPLTPYCEEMSFPGCSLCAPFRSTDFCDTTTSFPSLIQQRTSQFRNNPSALEVDGYWFQYLEDKIAAYLLTVDQLAPAPEIFCCETDVAQLYQCLEDKVFTKDLDGIVIKATNFHSNQGVFVLVNQTGTGQRTDPMFDLIQNLPTTYNDTMAALAHMQATKIIVEEFVGKSLPTEYKFHVVNGEIAAIDIIDGRDGDCPCYAVVDTAWNRLDKFGCFEPGGFELIDKATSCTAIDFETGKRKAGPIKKDLYMCDQIPKISDCLLNEMAAIALDLGNRIGVYMRVDMFVVGNAVYVQEYSANHMNGLRHCAAKTDANGCIDSCFMGDVLFTTVTADDGQYSFTGVPAGNYSVAETNPAGFPVDISAYDVTNDNDPTDGIPSVDKNVINVTLTSGEVDDGNSFVDSVDPVESPSPAPSANPDAPISLYCEEMSFPGCSVCAPFRSTDFCDTTTSFPSLIQQRTSQFRNNPSALEVDGYWFQYLEDKIAAYLLTVEQLAPAPAIFCCETDVAKLYQCLEDKVFAKDLDGIVIKATNFHSNQGVFVLVNETGTGQRSDPMFDLIPKISTTYNDTMAALAYMQATKIVVEEFVGKSLPTEYKFHVVNGEIAAIDIIDGRDGDCPCYAVVDTAWNRLGKYGCFEPGGIEHHTTTSCTSIDFETGKRKAGAIKKDLYMCDQIPKISDCLLNEMVGIALDLGKRIGVYIRVDMFVVGNSVYVQEYSANRMNGLRHCAAKTDENGCIDSCFMGRMWNDAGAPFGGTQPARRFCCANSSTAMLTDRKYSGTKTCIEVLGSLMRQALITRLDKSLVFIVK